MTPLSPPAAPGTVAGWKLVPLEPTEEMVAAWPRFNKGAGHERAIYAAMLAAAPSPEALPASGVEADTDWRRWIADTLTGMRQGDGTESDEVLTIAAGIVSKAPPVGGDLDALVERVKDVVLTDWFRHTSDPEASRRVVVRSVVRRLANLGALTSAPAPEDRADG
jgi:hypothetical protein